MTPSRTQAQRLEALRYANEIRAEQAETIKAIKAMDHEEAVATVKQILLDPKGDQSRFRVRRLLGAIPYLGPVKVTRIFREADVRERDYVIHKTNAHFGLTLAQRSRLCACLQEWADDRSRKLGSR